MKKLSTLVTSLTLTLVIGVSSIMNATVLNPGDIALLTCSSDDNDAFSFILLTDISGTTDVLFTDLGWDSTANEWTTANEGIITWSFTGSLTCGTVVNITDASNGSYAASTGTLTKSGTFNIASGGDQILVLQGDTATPSFIYCFNQDATGFGATVGSSSDNTNIPPGLTEGVNAFSTNTHHDNWEYNCSTTSGSASILAALMLDANYNFNDTAEYSLPGCSLFSCAPCAATASITVDSNISCNGLTDGGLTANGANGTGPYTYAWSNSGNAAAITGLAGIPFTVTVTDAVGCTATATESITEPSAVTASITVDSNISCNGLTDGGLTASGSGGTVATAYNYLWSNGGPTASIDGLSAITYTVTVTDDNGCTITASEIILEPTALGLTVTLDSNAKCDGSFDGGATASPTGGTTPYTYSWSNSGATASVNDLDSGWHIVTVTDTNGCVIIDSVMITDPTPLTLTATATNAGCNGAATGSITTQSGGGLTPYTYLWSNAEVTADINALTSGTYTLTLTDSNGCVKTTTASIGQPLPLSPGSISFDESILVLMDTVCFNNPPDTMLSRIDASGSLGSSSYVYQWQDSTIFTSWGPANGIINDSTHVSGGLNFTTYFRRKVSVPGCNESIFSNVIKVEVIEELILGLNAIKTTCPKLENGAVSTTPTGGLGLYSYEWSNGDSVTVLNDIGIGVYTVTVNDEFGCADTASVEVLSTFPAPVIDLGPDTITLPLEFNTITVESGFTLYKWSNGDFEPTATIGNEGSYSLTVTDSNGCKASDTIYIILTVGIDDVDAVSLRIYPNPAKDEVFVNTTDGRVPDQLILRDLGGRMIMSANRASQLNVGNVSKGIYLLEVAVGEHRTTKQIIIE